MLAGSNLRKRLIMNDIKKLLGKRIKELRKSQGISQQFLAEKANIDQRSLSHIECGDTFPSRALFDIANALNADLKDLFDFEHHKLDTNEMKKYIVEKIENLSDEDIKILFRMIKSMN